MASSHHFIVRSGPGPDRNRIITDMDGWHLANFLNNPVVLLNHDVESPPIGKATALSIQGNQMHAHIEFAATDIGREIDDLVRHGFMAGTSIHAKPIRWEFEREDGLITAIHSHEQELLELSVVNIPADPRALKAALQGEEADLTLHVLDQAATPAQTHQPPRLAAFLNDLNQELRSS